MNRLTIKSDTIANHYTLKCMCGFCPNGEIDDEDGCEEYCSMQKSNKGIEVCETCGIQKAFDKLAAYENTGLEPHEIVTTIMWQD